MTHHFFHDPRTIRRLHEGPLGEHIDAFAAQLQEQGYAPEPARMQLRVVVELSRWLERQGRAAMDLTPSGVQAYLRYRRRQGLPFHGAAAACQKCLRLLRDRGLVAPERPRPLSAREQLEHAFARYLAQDRGLAAATLVNYVPVVRQFLRERFRARGLRLAALRAGDITGFVQRHAHDHSPGQTKVMLTALRAFLRYLGHCGATATDLAPCVPSVPIWRFATLPRSLQPGQVQQVLDACDRQTARGRRDYAILLLLARLGLRAGEVVALRLEDIDWAAGLLTLRGKWGCSSQLLLPRRTRARPWPPTCGRTGAAVPAARCSSGSTRPGSGLPPGSRSRRWSSGTWRERGSWPPAVRRTATAASRRSVCGTPRPRNCSRRASIARSSCSDRGRNRSKRRRCTSTPTLR